MADTLPLIHQPDRVTRKASDVSVADWRYQTHEKKLSITIRGIHIKNSVVVFFRMVQMIFRSLTAMYWFK